MYNIDQSFSLSTKLIGLDKYFDDMVNLYKKKKISKNITPEW